MMNKRAALMTTGLAAVLALAPMTSAQAATKYKVDFDGQGTYTVGADGSAVVTGRATGTPFDGRYRAVLRADDGTLPDPGQCEPGSATVRLDGTRGRYLELSSDDEICGQYLQPLYVVTHLFTGRYDVTMTSERRLRGGDGFLEIRLATEGRAGVFAIDT
jgi:hypothetical protein